jgi:hypothetical protein
MILGFARNAIIEEREMWENFIKLPGKKVKKREQKNYSCI